MARTPLFRKFILTLQTARCENFKAEGLPLPLPSNANNWTRRKFVKTTAAFGAAGLASGCLSYPVDAEAIAGTPRIAIIGAGIAGLNAAYQLKKAGFKATVYEARPRIGGRMLSVDIGDGLIVDLGAELINTDHADMLELVKELDIALFNRVEDVKDLPFPKEAYYFNGVSISEAQLARDLRHIAKQITADAALLDQDWDTYAPQFDALSVADYLAVHADKINKPYIFELFKDVIHTEYGVEPHESTAIQLILVLPVIDGQSVELLSYSDEVYSVVGGSAQITNALGKELAGQIQLGMKLTQIKEIASRFRLTFANETTVDADLVIVAIPFQVLKSVEMKAQLPKQLSLFINEAKLGSNEKVIGRFTKRFWQQMKGFTNAAWGDLGFSEVWDATSRQSSRTDGALNFFLGGDQARQSVIVNKAVTLGNQFTSRLNHFIPGALEAATGKFVKTSWTVNSLTTGGYANYKPGQLTQFGSLLWIESDLPDEQQQVNVGNLIFAGEHLSDAYYGFMNGAAQTGRLAANLALKNIAALGV
jgi:monoamine oxidase